MIKKLHIDGPFIMMAIGIIIILFAIFTLAACGESAKTQSRSTDFSSPSNPYFQPPTTVATLPQGSDGPTGVIRGAGVWFICEPDGTTTYMTTNAILNIPHSKYCPSK